MLRADIADNLAFFALAKYIQGKIGSYDVLCLWIDALLMESLI